MKPVIPEDWEWEHADDAGCLVCRKPRHGISSLCTKHRKAWLALRPANGGYSTYVEWVLRERITLLVKRFD